MSQVVRLMFVQFLISAVSRTRILEDLTHRLEWSMRFRLTGQEWWPRAKQQALLATAHLSLQLETLSHGNTLYSSHTGISSKLLQGMKMAVLFYQMYIC